MSTTPRITACICTYNRYELLPKAIASLRQQTLQQPAYRIMVVDNSPDHERSEQVGQSLREAGFLDYRIEKVAGLSNARNVAARNCGTEFIAYMDDDAIASPQWLQTLLGAFDEYGDKVVTAGGRVDPIWEIPRPVWLHDWNIGYISVVDWGGSTRIAKRNEWLAGTNIAFRVAPLLAYGGFDAALGRTGGGAILLGNEEIAMLHNFREQGLLSIYTPEASVNHLVEKNRLTQTWFRKRACWQALSDFMMDPAAAAEGSVRDWHAVLDYFFRIPPRHRTVLGFYLDTDDPELFFKQLRALVIFTLGSLTGFAGVGEIGAAARA